MDWKLFETKSKEPFVAGGEEPAQASKRGAQMPTVPPATTLVKSRERPVERIGGYANPTELGGAPIEDLARTNSFPYQDPALQKASLAQLDNLKQDMDGFAAFELPYIQNRSDPAIKLPLTRFQGDYRRVKDEVLVLSVNEGINSQITMEELNTAAANLRFLQRSYRVMADNQIVPPPKTPETRAGLDEMPSVEGFSTAETTPITLEDLKTLSQKLAVEITRLQASGTTDPVLTARVNIFTEIKQQVDAFITSIENGTMSEAEIPIMRADYDNFLPVLGDSSIGIGEVIGEAIPTWSSLFNNYAVGDISGAEIANALFEKYANDLIKGSSFKVTFSYTSENEVKKEEAKAVSGVGNLLRMLLPSYPGEEGARGNFEEMIRKLDIAGFLPGAEKGTEKKAEAKGPAHFDWKERAEAIRDNIKRAGYDPSDFGCLPPGAAVSSEFSWRGHAKMVCSRLETLADSAPEQMGCPPANWKGWAM